MGIHFWGWLEPIPMNHSFSHPWGYLCSFPLLFCKGWLANCFDAFQLWSWGVQGWRSGGKVETPQDLIAICRKEATCLFICFQKLGRLDTDILHAPVFKEFYPVFLTTCSHAGWAYSTVSKGLGFNLKFIYFWEWHSWQAICIYIYMFPNHRYDNLLCVFL